METTVSYARLIRPVIDRVYVGARWAARARMEAFYAERGVDLGFENSFFSGVLARPMSAEALADGLAYTDGDMTRELAQGVTKVDAEGTWHLTELGRELALYAQRATAGTQSARVSVSSPCSYGSLKMRLRRAWTAASSRNGSKRLIATLMSVLSSMGRGGAPDALPGNRSLEATRAR